MPRETPSSDAPTDTAEAAAARRSGARIERAALAEIRWRDYRQIARRLATAGDRTVDERRLDRMLARGKWPGRMVLLARSGLWDRKIVEGLGLTPAPTCSLMDYVRAGPDPDVQPKALFDQTWYLDRHPELAGSRWAPLAHYLVVGDQAGYSPHPLVDVKHYRASHAVKVAASGMSVLQHFAFVGALEGYSPHPLFDVRYYVGQSPELARTGENPLAHYLHTGWREGLDPHPLFANDWYLQRNPDVAALGIAPLLHYVVHGAREGRDPHPLFDQTWYVERYRDVGLLGATPLAHFLEHGARDRRSPGPWFDTAYYLEQNPEVAARGDNPLVDYLTRGAFEGAWPAGDFDELAYAAAHPEAAETASLDHWARTSAERPAPVSGGRGGGAEALFEQLRANGRVRDPAAYDLQAYLDLAAAGRRIEAERQSGFQPKPPAMIRIDEVGAAPSGLTFERPAQPAASIVIPAYNNLKFTLECLAALQAAGGLDAAEVLVIDDASTDATAKVLGAVPGLTVLTNPENLGFIGTCNRAGEAARGEFLIFLNNDVQVRPGWLAALLAPFAEEADVGATAPKMLFPDGRLQEAGARIGVDGTAEMIGLGEDPTLPRWNVRREVDYASGACLAVRRAVFQELGGFDRAFMPAYCEDADLCFRLRERGLKVIYEPRAEIVHHLSVTSNSIDAGYKLRLATRNQQRFVERWGERLEALNRVRTIAFHLPQFHAIAENDRWWGAGFTEWTNVTRALPNWRGQHQPQLPADLGFYDLSDPRALRKQIALAERYGIGGFCHYFYWFSGGRRVLEKPLEALVAPDAPDFPFCLCWANENWTRTWDGQEKDVLLSQTYADGDAAALIAEMTPFLKRPNYIRVGGKPLVLIYRPGLLPDPRAWTEAWRAHCRAEGIGEIHLAFVENFENAQTYPDPAPLGFDATVEFPPAGVSTPINPPGPLVNPRFEGVANDYRALVRHYLAAPVPGHRRYRGVMPSWDNTARRQDQSYAYAYATPGAFQAWLEAMMADTRRQNFGDERIVFINAWNEWAEGAHLEPDVRFGHGWLEAVKNAAEADLLGPA